MCCTNILEHVQDSRLDQGQVPQLVGVNHKQQALFGKKAYLTSYLKKFNLMKHISDVPWAGASPVTRQAKLNKKVHMKIVSVEIQSYRTNYLTMGDKIHTMHYRFYALKYEYMGMSATTLEINNVAPMDTA